MKLLRRVALALAAPVAYSLIEPYRFVIRRHDVVLPRLPADFDGLRVLQVSDIHCSAITSPRLVARLVDLCNRESADIVMLTGDYVSRRNSYAAFSLARVWARPLMHYAEAVAIELGRLRAPLGVFAVPGNHDQAAENFKTISALLGANGIECLVNRNVRLRDVLPLVGLDDLRAGRPLLDQAFEGTQPEEPQIVLAHNPRLLWRLAQRNALVLSGHTHSGQVHLPGTSFRRQPSDMEFSNLYEGWYYNGDAQMYVSAGTGSVHFPMRFDCPPEIAVFALRMRPLTSF